jgi:hypothetical protein
VRKKQSRKKGMKEEGDQKGDERNLNAKREMRSRDYVTNHVTCWYAAPHA